MSPGNGIYAWARGLCWALAIQFVAMGGAWAQEGRPLAVYYFERPPFYFGPAEDPQGLLVERTRRVMARAGVPVVWRKSSPMRILETIQRGERAVGIGWFQNPGRLKFARFSRPIHRDGPLVMLVNTGVSCILPPGASLTQVLRFGFSVCLQEGFSYGAYADQMFSQEEVRPVRVSGDQSTLARMVARGRCGMMLADPLEGQWLCSQARERGEYLKMLPLGQAPPGNQRYLMYSLQVEPELIEKVDQALESLYPDLGR